MQKKVFICLPHTTTIVEHFSLLMLLFKIYLDAMRKIIHSRESHASKYIM